MYEAVILKYYYYLSIYYYRAIRKESFSPGTSWPGCLVVKRLAQFCSITEAQDCSVEIWKSREVAAKACLAETNNARGNLQEKIFSYKIYFFFISRHDLAKHSKNRESDKLFFFPCKRKK